MAMHHVCLVPRAEKRVLEPLELQLLTVMKMAGDSILGPPKEQSGLLATEPSLHPPSFALYITLPKNLIHPILLFLFFETESTVHLILASNS